jgi:hypothetical protein
MNQLLTIEYPQIAGKFKSVAFGDGLPAYARWVREGILAQYTAPVKVKAKTTAPQPKVRKVAKRSSTKPVKKATVKSVKAKSSVKKTSVKKK